MQISPDSKNIGVDALSLSVIRLEMMFGELVIGIGSGFLWKRGGKHALVTAWHNFTGTHPYTGDSLTNKTGARPDRFRAYFQTGQTGMFAVLNQLLYEASGAAGWLVHPEAGEQVDIAVIPINVRMPDDLAVLALNHIANSPMATPIGAEVFIIGFPRGISESGLPVWKRGSLASEPALFADETGRRRVLVDSATREGLSGAPVVARSVGSYLSENGALVVGQGISTRTIGVYTGRMASRDELDAQIGIVWPWPLIERIFDTGQPDTFELHCQFSPRESG